MWTMTLQMIFMHDDVNNTFTRDFFLQCVLYVEVCIHVHTICVGLHKLHILILFDFFSSDLRSLTGQALIRRRVLIIIILLFWLKIRYIVPNSYIPVIKMYVESCL